MKNEIKLNLTDYQKEILLAILDEQANKFDSHQTKTDQRAIALDDIASQIETYTPLNSDKENAIKLAGYFLACQPDQVEATIRLIINHYDENDLIDDIEGVDVCTKFENSFTVESFADQIGWKEEF